MQQQQPAFSPAETKLLLFPAESSTLTAQPRKLRPARLAPAHREPSWVQILYGPVAPFSPVRGVQSFPRHQAPDAVGPVGHKQRGPDIRPVRGAGRAWGLGFRLLQHLTTATASIPPPWGPTPAPGPQGVGGLT